MVVDGEVIDAKTKKIVALLKDEAGHEFQSEKMLEIVIDNGKVVKAGDQFGIGGNGRAVKFSACRRG